MWIVPRMFFRLTAGPLTPLNVTFLVVNSELAAEDLLVELLILQHLGIDMNTMLEQNRYVLDGTECSLILDTKLSEGKRHNIRQMLACSSCIEDNLTPENELEFKT